MKSIAKEILKPTIMVSVVCAVIGLVFNVTVSLGILLGSVFSVWHLYRIERNVDAILGSQKNIGKTAFLFLTDLVLLSCPLLIAVAFPTYFNVVGVAVGLLSSKIALYLNNFKRGV